MNPITQIAGLLILLSVTLSVGADSVPDSSSGHVSHIVIRWLKKPGDIEARRQFVDVTKSFANLPGVVDHKVGVVLPSDRKVVDSSFDVATVITFKNRKSLQAYLDHPRHKTAVKEMLKPLVEKIIVYDIDLK